MTHLEKIHNHSLDNREELSRSGRCGCFSCGTIFDVGEIEGWTDEGRTALCPYCGTDAVIGDAAGVTLDEDFLNAMFTRYFQ